MLLNGKLFTVHFVVSGIYRKGLIFTVPLSTNLSEALYGSCLYHTKHVSKSPHTFRQLTVITKNKLVV